MADNRWLLLLAVIGLALLAMPAVRRWWSNGEDRPLVDPEQSITVDPVMDQGAGWFRYRLNHRSRRAARGRRHVAPSTPSPTRVHRDPPDGMA